MFILGLCPIALAQQSISQADQQEIQKLAIEIRKAIIKEDVEWIIKHLSKNGLTCTDTRIPYQQVKKYLYDKNSHLYMSLFDTARWSQQCGDQYPAEYPAISDKEFFTNTMGESIEVVPYQYLSGWAKVTYKSRNKHLWPREYYFHKEGKEWKLGNGFILSRCTCG